MSKKKKKRQRRTSHRQPRPKLPLWLMLVGGLLLILGGLLAWKPISANQAPLQVNPEDIVYDEGLYAIHEMEEAQLDAIPFLPEDGPQPHLVIPDDFYNFNAVAPTAIVTHDFYLVNTGEAPLTITRAYTTCGCTTATISASVIPPGKAALVTIIFDAGYHDVRGQVVRRGLIIESNDRQQPEAEIWIQAAVTR